MGFNNSPAGMRQRIARQKAGASKARSYGGGFMSMAQMAGKMGFKGFGQANKVKWALIRGGYAIFDGTMLVPTEKGKAHSRLHSEEDPKTPGVEKQWFVWNESIIDIVKFFIDDYAANPDKYSNKEDQAKSSGFDYPDGFASVTTIASNIDCHRSIITDFLVRRRFALNDSGKISINTEIRGHEKFGSVFESTRSGKVESWCIWNAEKIGQFVNKYLAEHPEIDRHNPVIISKVADPTPDYSDDEE